MTIARRHQVSLEHTPYYHCMTRCVRQAFLCGEDRYSGRNFDHRKEWMERRLMLLSRIFAIDLLAYAVMSNHYHVVVCIDIERVSTWTDEEVAKRWGKIFSLPKAISTKQIQCWRGRLFSLSWFMRCLNEPIARMANREDGCRGRFWDGRFKCQALLDEAALLKCMVYVDLNPIRVGIAKTPESSSHTSIKARIEQRDGHLAPFIGGEDNGKRPLRIQKNDYFSLVDWTGRQLHVKKRGRIPAHLPPIMKRVGIDNGLWLSELKYYSKWYFRAVGSIHALEHYRRHLGQKWLRGIRHVAKMTV